MVVFVNFFVSIYGGEREHELIYFVDFSVSEKLKFSYKQT